jgi:hypothetical protein
MNQGARDVKHEPAQYPQDGKKNEQDKQHRVSPFVRTVESTSSGRIARSRRPRRAKTRNPADLPAISLAGRPARARSRQENMPERQIVQPASAPPLHRHERSAAAW